MYSCCDSTAPIAIGKAAVAVYPRPASLKSAPMGRLCLTSVECQFGFDMAEGYLVLALPAIAGGSIAAFEDSGEGDDRPDLCQPATEFEAGRLARTRLDMTARRGDWSYDRNRRLTAPNAACIVRDSFFRSRTSAHIERNSRAIRRSITSVRPHRESRCSWRGLR